MEFKYAEEMALVDNCPPSNAVARETEAFRYVHEEIGNVRNFLCDCKLNPARKLAENKRCSGLGLSFFDSEENARKAFEYLRERNPKIGKSLGDKLALGHLRSEDGRMSQPNSKGHFDLWEAVGVEFADRFEIIGDLMK